MTVECESGPATAGPGGSKSKHLAAALIVFCAAVEPSSGRGVDSADSPWERRGPASGSPPIVTVSPDGERLYAVWGRELYRSDDGGVHWTTPTPFRAAALVADPVEPGRLYALSVDAAGGGLIRSDDAGVSFVPVVEEGDLLASTRPGKLAVGRSRAGGRLLVATGRSTVLTSIDDGRSWRRAIGLPGAWWAQVDFVVVDPTTPGRIYVTEAVLGGLFSSADDGLTFRRERRGLPVDVRPTALVIDPSTSRRILLASERNGLRRGLYWQAAPGQAWRRRENAVPSPWRLSSPLEVGSGSWRALGWSRFGDPWLFGSADGRTWHRLVRPAPPIGVFGGSLLSVGERLLLSSRDGLLLSPDDGRSWTPIAAPFHLESFGAVTFDPRGGGAILADRRWASFDGGASWERTAFEVGELVLWGEPLPVADLPRQYLSLAIEPQEYSCRHAGFAHSTDRGRSWTVVEPYPGAAFGLTPSRLDRDLLFAGIGREYQGCPHACNLVRSRDRGATFECLDEGVASILGLGGLYEVRLAPDDATVQVRGEGGWLASHDGGESWVPIVEPEELRILARGPVGSGVAYGRRGPQLEELVRTTDGGVSWQPLTPPPGPPYWVAGAVLATASETVALTGLGREVVVSRDGGATWLDVGAELPAAVERVRGIGFLDVGGQPTLFVGADAASGILALPLSAVPP